MNRFNGKNILFIYYKFPPIKGIGTLRNVKFYLSLKKGARKVFVVTTSNRHFLPQDEFQYDEKDVIEIPTFDFRTIYHYMTGGQGSLMKSRNRLPQRYLPQWKEKFKKSIISRYFDEGGAYFVHEGMKKCSRIVEKEKIDVIVSSYLPFDAHRLAFRLKKKYPHLYWIADYRDFFSDPMLRSGPGFARRQEKHSTLISHADELTTVSQGLKQRLAPFHPHVYVVRNGVTETLAYHPLPAKYKLFTMSYTGSIYPNAQNGYLLATVLHELVDGGDILKSHIQFINAGKDGLYWKELFDRQGMGDIVVDQGLIPHKDSLIIQKKSHVNVLLSWASDDVSGILTGKLFEYLAASSPILAIVNGNFDPELNELISMTGRGALFSQSDIGSEQLKEFLMHQYLNWLAIRNRPVPLHDQQMESRAGIITWQDEFESWANPGSTDAMDDSVIVNL